MSTILRQVYDIQDVRSVLLEWNSWINTLQENDIRNWSLEARQSILDQVVQFNKCYYQVTKVDNGAWALSFLKKITLGLEVLDSIHVLFLKFAIYSNNPQVAMELLLKKIEVGRGKVTDFLLYHYYGGIILASLRERELGLEYFKRVLIAPALVPSQIQIQAYKKLILMCLLIHGRFNIKSHVPSYISPVLKQVVKGEAAPYLNFALAFSTLDSSKIQTEYKKNYDLFSRQGNLGLVKQVLQSYLDHLKKKVEKVYSRIYFSELEKEKWVIIEKNAVHKLSRKELETFISNSGNVLLDDRSGEVSFRKSQVHINHEEIMEKLTDIGLRFSEWNKSISLSEEYMSRIVSRNEMVESKLFNDGLQDMDFV